MTARGKFGKRPARHDPRTLRLMQYVDKSRIGKVPLFREWTIKVDRWGMYRNNEIGDCAVASPAHMIQGWTASDGLQRPVSDADVVAAYSAISGYVPGDDSTDRGCYMLDVLRHWRTHGIGGHKIHAYLAIDPSDHMQRMMAIELFGCVYGGFMLPDTIWAERVWSNTSGRIGSAGGHAMGILGYSPSSLTAITWGSEQLITPEFADWCMDEAYVVLPDDDWTGPDGVAPNGLRFEELERDLERVTA